jgi:hypothetical protein
MACRSIVTPFLSYTNYTHLPLDTQSSELQHFWCWGFCGGGATGAWGMPATSPCLRYLTVPPACAGASSASFKRSVKALSNEADEGADCNGPAGPGLVFFVQRLKRAATERYTNADLATNENCFSIPGTWQALQNGCLFFHSLVLYCWAVWPNLVATAATGKGHIMWWEIRDVQITHHRSFAFWSLCFLGLLFSRTGQPQLQTAWSQTEVSQQNQVPYVPSTLTVAGLWL